MGSRSSLVEKIGLGEELIKKACSFSMKAHGKFPAKLYLHENIRSSNHAVFAFTGSWAARDWYSSSHDTPFGETEVDTNMFPSLRSVGTDEVAAVNAAFCCRFAEILNNTSLYIQVEKALAEGKQIVFTGHSSGGSVATLAAIWCLDTFFFSRKPPQTTIPFCVTFGCPLTGDRIFSHALRRERWDRHFIHFVTRYDLVPRLTLAPLSSITDHLLQTFSSFPISPNSHDDMTSTLFSTVMRNACVVTSHAASALMGSTNLLLETVSSIVPISPYRPFGTFVFCTENGKMIVVENSEAVLQMLFFSSQIVSETEGPEVAKKSFEQHFWYESAMRDGLLEMNDVVDFCNLTGLPLSPDSSPNTEAARLNAAAHDLGLSSRARLCIRAAGEWAKQKEKNEEKIDGYKSSMREGLRKIGEYQTKCEVQKLGCYDSFRMQKTIDDFNANVKRLELAGIMDEIVEMLKRHELPDEFEARQDWVILGTQFRRLVEPLDIANYYRHLKNEDTGPYMITARPKRYKYTQRWLDHAKRKPKGECSESCFWAEVEELKNIPAENLMREMHRIVKLEERAKEWLHAGFLGKDVFFDQSTFAKWWKSLPLRHRRGSWISEYLTT